jgi:ABC-type Fe3+ transport system permease subunit
MYINPINIGKKQRFMSNGLSNWKEPAYGERKEHGEKILIATLTIGMAAFVIIIMTMFIWQFSTKPNELSDTLYSFWGSIIGAMIAGLVTICTTYLIIRRSYKIDYHRERMDVLPFFEIKMIKKSFFNE